MKPITSPLRFGDRSPEVANLQDGLLLLLCRQIICVLDEERGVLEEGLLREQQEQAARSPDLVGCVTSTHQITEKITQNLLRDISHDCSNPINNFPFSDKTSARSHNSLAFSSIELKFEVSGDDRTSPQPFTSDV